MSQYTPYHLLAGMTAKEEPKSESINSSELACRGVGLRGFEFHPPASLIG